MIVAEKRHIDEIIESSRAPRVPWPGRKNPNCITVTEREDNLQEIMDNVQPGTIIKLVGKRFRGFQLRRDFGQYGGYVTWVPPRRESSVVAIVNGNIDGTIPILEGIGVFNLLAGSELWLVNIGIKPSEWWHEEDQEWQSNNAIIGTNYNCRGVIRMYQCVLMRAEKASTYTKDGIYHGIRTYTVGLHLVGCKSEDGVLAKEWWVYFDNAPFCIQVNCDWGASGRGHFQGGTRLASALPHAFLGILIQGCNLHDAFIGSATASCATIYGNPALTIVKDTVINNPAGAEGLPAGGLLVWRTWNYLGNELDEHGYPNSMLVVDNVKINIGEGKLDAAGFNWVYEAHIRGLDTSGSHPGSNPVSSPNLYDTVGINDLTLYGPPFPLLRSHTGPSGVKSWHTWTEEELKAHAWRPSTKG